MNWIKYLFFRARNSRNKYNEYQEENVEDNKHKIVQKVNDERYLKGQQESERVSLEQCGEWGGIEDEQMLKKEEEEKPHINNTGAEEMG